MAQHAMKQIVKKPSPASFVPLVVVVIGILFHPQITTPPMAPTGRPATNTPTVVSSTVPQNTSITDSKPSGYTPTKQQIAKLTAPKQAAIIDSVTTEYVYHMFGSVNDPLAASDWTIAKDNAPAAWDISTGNNQTIVADIDTGFALNHQDLTSQWYQNPGETGTTKAGDRCWTGVAQDKSTNNCDDDNNGYIDDWRGWNFVKADNNPQAGRINPTGQGVSHGTETAGLIGASGNNGFGSTAINQHTKIMPLAVLDDDGVGYTSDIAAAIYYAVANGAAVINLSLGTYSVDPALKTAITYASNHSVVVVAAAGNCGDGSSPDCPATAGAIAYPALYPDVIAVGASTSADARASFSSYGAALDVSAPGYNLPVAPSWSAGNQTSLYASGLYGTSFASPQVASLASLIKSIRPSTSATDISALIEATATKPSAMNGLFYTEQLGHGIINAGSALGIASSLTSATPTLWQTGSATAEHEMYTGNSISSGCTVTSTNSCTIQFTGSSGYARYLPYQTGLSMNWSWVADSLESDVWETRARSGDTVSTTPYLLLKK